jgi:hypothetical protein
VPAILALHRQNGSITSVKKSGNIVSARSPRFTYVFFPRNFCNVCGVASVQLVDIAVQELCSIFAITSDVIRNIKIDNIMATGRVRPFPTYLELERYACDGSSRVLDCCRTEYDREKFPSVKLEFAPRGCAMIFRSGKVNLLGCREQSEVDRILNAIATSLEDSHSQ